MPDWAIAIVAAVIGSLIGGGIIAIITHRINVRANNPFASRLTRP